MAINANRPVTPQTNVRKPVAQAPATTTTKVAAPAKPATQGHTGAVVGSVAGAGVMTAAYVALRWFSNPTTAGIAAVGIGLAALGGKKIGDFVDRGFKYKDIKVGGLLGGAAAVTAYGGGALLLGSFSKLSPVMAGLMIAGSGLAMLGGSAIGRGAHEWVVGLFTKK